MARPEEEGEDEGTVAAAEADEEDKQGEILQEEPVAHYDEAVAADPTIEDAPGENEAEDDDAQAQAQPMAAPAVDDEPAPMSQEVQQ